MTNTVNGTHGSGETPCEIYTLEKDGGTWYAVHDSQSVNFTFVELEDGVDVETLVDMDNFTSDEPITSEQELQEATNPTEESMIESLLDSITNGQWTQARGQWEDIKEEHATEYRELFEHAEIRRGLDMARRTLSLAE